MNVAIYPAAYLRTGYITVGMQCENPRLIDDFTPYGMTAEDGVTLPIEFPSCYYEQLSFSDFDDAISQYINNCVTSLRINLNKPVSEQDNMTSEGFHLRKVRSLLELRQKAKENTAKGFFIAHKLKHHWPHSSRRNEPIT